MKGYVKCDVGDFCLDSDQGMRGHSAKLAKITSIADQNVWMHHVCLSGLID